MQGVASLDTKHAGLQHKMFFWLLAVVLTVVFIFYINLNAKIHLNESKQLYNAELHTLASKLETELNRRLFITESLEKLRTRKTSMDAFIVQLLQSDQNILKGIQISQGTTVSHVYPASENEAHLGLDLLQLPGQREALLHSIQSGKLILTGPHETPTQEKELIAYKPFYNDGVFQGLTSVIIDWQALLDESGINQASHLHLALRTDKSPSPILGEEEVFSNENISLKLSVADMQWELAAIPRSGWPQLPPLLAFHMVGGLAIFLLFMGTFWFWRRYPQLLQEQVMEATEALHQSRDELEIKVEERTAALAASELRLRLMLDSLPFPVIVISQQQNYPVYANEAAILLFEDDNHSMGCSTRDYFQCEEDYQRLLDTLQKCELKDLEVHMRTRNGHEFWALLSAVKTVYENEEALLATIHDISGRKDMELALERSEHNFRTVFDSVPTPMAITETSDGKVKLLNPSAIRLFAVQHRDYTEFYALDYYEYPEDREQLFKEIQKKGFVDNYELQMHDHNGHIFDLIMTAVPITFNGQSALLTSFTDITGRKEDVRQLQVANCEAQQAIRAKNEFLATMSHEIRTPLNGMLNMVQLLERTELNDKQQEYLRSINYSGDLLLQIICDVLDLSRLEAGKVSLEKADFDLHEQAHELVEVIRMNVDANKVNVQVHIDRRIPHCMHADSTRLRQVLFNLLGNALKFTERGEIQLGIRQVSRRDRVLRLKFEVCDTGIGIAPDMMDKLFEPFSQGDSSISRRYGGSGLGLAICKRMIETMGGNIGVSSKPGQGSRFSFYLDLEIAQKPTRRNLVEGIEEAEQPNNKLRVLLVDDDDISRISAKALLQQQGHEVEVASDGYDALRKFQNGQYDIILMDVRMPGMDGLQTTRRIRDMEAGCSRTPILALTADVTTENFAQCKAAQMDGVLAKPFQVDRLQKELVAVMKQDATVH